jgi:UDP-N-acetylmuramyl pentapeptide synthase
MYVLKRFKPTIIAVTGNVGKTSTKDAIFYALRPYGHVRRSEKSFNSDTGVPLSILGVPNGWNSPMLWATNIFHGFTLMFFTKTYPEYLVLEIGADHPGDIRSVSAWVKPHISVFTRFPDVPVHIEFFDSVEAVVQEKTSLAINTRKDGTLILNADDSKVMKLDGLDGRKTYTYSAENPSDIQIKNITYHFSETDAVHGSDTTLLVKDRGEIHMVLPHIISHGHIAGAVCGAGGGLSSGCHDPIYQGVIELPADLGNLVFNRSVPESLAWKHRCPNYQCRYCWSHCFPNLYAGFG